MMRAWKFSLVVGIIALLVAPTTGRGQSPAPVVVEAASSAPVAEKATAASAQDPGSLEAAIALLEQIKAANAEVLKKQEATLQRLDELQQDAEQLKIFSKRG